MKIIVPNNNIEERKYIIDILIGEFLGLNYKVEIRECSNYEIILDDNKKLIIEDHFFKKFTNKLEYLEEKNIPDKIKLGLNKFTVEENIPIIYGTDKIVIRAPITTDSLIIICGIDIFASAFFMLTRWEEYVNMTRDKHNRFPATASLAYKNNFLDRPIVNEYVEMLWNMLAFLGCKQKRKKKEFKFILTHDIDHAYKYKNIGSCIREIIGDILKRKSLNLAFKNLRKQILTKLGKLKDPFDTYDYLIDISEELGIKSYFFLHSSGSSKFDNNNDKFLRKISQKILSRGHYVGYHPSYNAYNNLDLFLKDKEKIENIVGQKLTFGRQHYLRFEIPTTWRLWEEAKMEWDSTLGYADREGFRCGTCYEYSPFDIINRRRLKLKEKPLIAMESSFVYQLNVTPQYMEKKIQNLIDRTRKYNGEFVFLWHNSSFNTHFWQNFGSVYKAVLLNAMKN